MEKISLMKYFIAIIPPEPIATEIYKIKEYVHDQYKSKGSLNSPTHITLHMPFEWEKEEKLVSTLKRFEFEKFNIELNDFGCFEPRVIFVDVKKNESLNLLQSRLATFCKTELNLFNSQYRDLPFHPHVTIAFRDLKKPMFEAAWNEFKSRKYSAVFQCSRLSLMKHDGKFWREFS
jgi:2'-5' RNA ligase